MSASRKLKIIHYNLHAYIYNSILFHHITTKGFWWTHFFFIFFFSSSHFVPAHKPMHTDTPTKSEHMAWFLDLFKTLSNFFKKIIIFFTDEVIADPRIKNIVQTSKCYNMHRNMLRLVIMQRGSRGRGAEVGVWGGVGGVGWGRGGGWGVGSSQNCSQSYWLFHISTDCTTAN